MSRQIWRGAVFLFALAMLVAQGSVVGAQQPTGGIGGRVVNPDPNNPRSQSIFIYTLKQGESKQDQILVLNPTDETQTITLGSVDGVVTNTGDYTCRQEAEPVTDIGSWVQLSKREVTIPAGGQEKVDFTVNVPAGADVGEHNGCLTIQVQNDEGEEVSAGVRLRMRQAIRMIVTIPGDLRRELSIDSFMIQHGTATKQFSLFDKFTFDYPGNLQTYSMTSSNQGNVSADIDMRVKLLSIFGNEVANVGGEYPIVPGESLTKEFTSDHTPLFGGWYKATPSIRYDKRLGAFGTQSDQAEYETITGEEKTVFLWPTTAGWVIIVVVLLLLTIIIWRGTGHIKKLRGLRRTSKRYTVKKADTIQTLARKSKVTWQELAELNDIEAPYSLEVGQKILLPNTPKVRKSTTRTTTKSKTAPKKRTSRTTKKKA